MERGEFPYRPKFRVLGLLVFRVLRPIVRIYASWRGLHASYSRRAKTAGKKFRKKLSAGDSVYLLGLGIGAHDTGACLLKVTKEEGPEILKKLRGRPTCRPQGSMWFS